MLRLHWPTFVAMAVTAQLVTQTVVQAAENTFVEPSAISLQMGYSDDTMALSADQLRLQKGKTYKLTVSNNSNVTHYFVPGEFAEAVRTQHLTVQGGRVAELRGGVKTRTSLSRGAPNSVTMKEIELRPGGHAEWIFVADELGHYPFMCGIPAHVEAGMRGEFVIERGIATN